MLLLNCAFLICWVPLIDWSCCNGSRSFQHPMACALWRMQAAQTALDRESSQKFTDSVTKTKLAPPPSSFEKKKRWLSLATTAYGELSQFLFLYGKCGVFQVKPFVAYTTCDLGSCVVRQTLWLFDISERWLTSFCHSHFFPSSLYPSID